MIGNILARILGTMFGFVGWLVRTTWEGWSGRSLAAEQADRAAQEAARQEAVETRDAEAAHRSCMEALALATLEATVAARFVVDGDAAVRAERRRRHEGHGSAHAEEVRSSRWLHLPSVDDEMPEPTRG